jgi:hypothetical protein
MECLILVLVDKSCDNARLVVQTQKGVDLLDTHSMEMNNILRSPAYLMLVQVELLQEIRVFVLESKIGLNFRDGQALLFNTNDGAKFPYASCCLYRSHLVRIYHFQSYSSQRCTLLPTDRDWTRRSQDFT